LVTDPQIQGNRSNEFGPQPRLLLLISERIMKIARWIISGGLFAMGLLPLHLRVIDVAPGLVDPGLLEAP
ncbi:hypothetical protein, partial [Bradyrhizobium elkanii]|uniref:hypothetical protein n=1 Tax=Bradyrhizobium elkanii TaxID=29448 RepID=UPI0014775CC5